MRREIKEKIKRDRERKRKCTHGDISLIPLQFGEIIVEALEECFPELFGICPAAGLLQVRAFGQRGELLSHRRRVFQISVMQKVLVTPGLLLLRVAVRPENVQQHDVVSLG